MALIDAHALVESDLLRVEYIAAVRAMRVADQNWRAAVDAMRKEQP